VTSINGEDTKRRRVKVIEKGAKNRDLRESRTVGDIVEWGGKIGLSDLISNLQKRELAVKPLREDRTV